MPTVLHELKLRYREFFESKFAIDILQSGEVFLSVTKISHEIARLMRANQSVIIASIKQNEQILKELCEPYFGSLFPRAASVSSDAIFDTMLAVLDHHQPDLSQVMQLHCLFIHRLYPALDGKKETAAWQAKLHPASFFSPEQRAREAVTTADIPPATTQLGISKQKVFSKMLGQSALPHQRGIDKFKPAYHSTFFQTTQQQQIPFACGPSSHTSSLMLGAKIYLDLNADELKEYAMISFAFLAAGGHHSFHEVMLIANLAGVDYQLSDYTGSLPVTIKSTATYHQLQETFPQFLG